MRWIAILFFLISPMSFAQVAKHKLVRPQDSKCLEPAIEFLTSVFSLDKDAKVTVERDSKRMAKAVAFEKRHGSFRYSVQRIFESTKDGETVELRGAGALILIDGTIGSDHKCKIINRRFRSAHENR